MVRSRVVDQAIEAAGAAVALHGLADEFVPLVQEAVGGSGSLLFEFGDNGLPRGVSGSLAPHIAAYNEKLFGQDPLQGALRAADPKAATVRLEDVVGYDAMRATPAFNEFYRPLGVEQLLGVWPTGQRFGSPGMVGLVIGRPLSARRFGARERRILESVLPAFRSAIHRDRRLRARERERAYAAMALARVIARPVFVVDARGEIVWRSSTATTWIEQRPDAQALMRALTTTAMSALRAARANGDLSPGPTPVILATERDTYQARLWIDRLPDGRFGAVLAVHDERACHEEVLASARRWGLTKAEAQVLACVARGLDNRSISEELSIAETTVKTHLRQISSKLGVANRTQAALLVHGVLPR